jgi:hypothetical protein
MIDPLIHCHVVSGMSMRSVLARSRSVKRTTDTPSDAVMM